MEIKIPSHFSKDSNKYSKFSEKVKNSCIFCDLLRSRTLIGYADHATAPTYTDTKKPTTKTR